LQVVSGGDQIVEEEGREVGVVSGGEKHVVGRNWKRGRLMRWILGERTN
jgi:hypothetical protein